MKEQQIQDKWNAGKSDELDFWEQLLPKDGNFKRADLVSNSAIYKKRLDVGNKVIIPELSPLLERIQKQVVQTLEVGPGPIPRLGIIRTDKRLIINTLDPLMEKYLNMMLDQDVDIVSMFPEGRFITGVAEEATRHFLPGSMDLIYCSNALDHCFDPIQAAQSLLEVCAPGGFMYISGLADEGKAQNYQGFHQWNLRVFGEDVSVSRPGCQSFTIRGSLRGVFKLKCYAQDRGARQSWHMEFWKDGDLRI